MARPLPALQVAALDDEPTGAPFFSVSSVSTDSTESPPAPPVGFFLREIIAVGKKPVKLGKACRWGRGFVPSSIGRSSYSDDDSVNPATGTTCSGDVRVTIRSYAAVNPVRPSCWHYEFCMIGCASGELMGWAAFRDCCGKPGDAGMPKSTLRKRGGPVPSQNRKGPVA
jgi:hypothetical protein